MMQFVICSTAGTNQKQNLDISLSARQPKADARCVRAVLWKSSAPLALIGAGAGQTWVGAFSKAVFKAQFAQNRSIRDETVIGEIMENLGLAGAELIQQAQMSTIKEQLRNQTERAQKIGVFGAPSFVTEDGELFWGDDRLENALLWPVTL